MNDHAAELAHHSIDLLMGTLRKVRLPEQRQSGESAAVGAGAMAAWETYGGAGQRDR